MRTILALLLFLAPLDALADGVLCRAGGTGTTNNACATSGQILISQGDGTLLEKTMSGDCTIDSDGVITCTGGGGSAIIVDFGDDGGNDSTDLSEIATTGDVNAIFSEPSADKLLIAVGNNWPTADAADALSTDPTDCTAGKFISGLTAAGATTCGTPTDTNAGSVCGSNEVLDGDGSCYDRIQKITGTPVDNQIVRWHSTDGKSIQVSACTIDDSGNIDCDGTVTGSCTPASNDCGIITDDNNSAAANPGAGKCHIYSRGENPYAICGAGGAEVDLAASAGGGDSVSIDSVAVTDPDFQDGGDINFTDTSNVITATLKDDVVAAAEMADADHGDVAWSSGVASVENVQCGSSCIADAEVDGDLTLAGATIGTSAITLVQGTAPTPTAEGVIEWETDDDHIIIGDGVDQVEFVPTEDVSGDITMTTGGAVSLADDVVAAAEMADADHGDVSWSSGVATVENLQCTGCVEDSEVSDTLTASTSTTASADDNDTSIATTAFVQQELKNHQWCETAWIEDPANDDDFLSLWSHPVAVTITELNCRADGGTSVTWDLNNDDGTPTGVNGSAMTCNSTHASDTSFAGDATLAADDYLELVITAVTGSVTNMMVQWCYTID